MIRFRSLELENYRQYSGKKFIDLETSQEKNLIVMVGPNGAGKTNLLNSIVWCLYGTEVSFRNQAERNMGPINDKIFRESGKEGRAEARVKLHIESEGKEIIVERSIGGFLTDSGQRIFEDSRLNVWLQSGRDMIKSEQPEMTISQLLPPVVKDFFFFDGEKLDDFFKAAGTEKVGAAIMDLSQISALDKVFEHLDYKLLQLRGESRVDVPQNATFQQRIESYAKGKVGLEESLREKREELAVTEMSLKSISDELLKSSSEIVKQVEETRKATERTISALEARQEELQEKSIEHLMESAPLIYLRDSIERTLALIEQKTQKGEIPPKFRETFLEELLERGKCICGTDITGGQQRDEVQRLLQSFAPLSKATEFISDGKFVLESQKKGARDFIDERLRFNRSLLDLDADLDKERRDLKALGQKLESMGNIEHISTKEKQRDELDSIRTRLIGEIKTHEVQIESAQERINDATALMDAEIKKSKKLDFLSRKIKIAEDAKSLVTMIRQNIIDAIRIDVEDKTNRYFQSLIWKKETFNRVEIDKSYKISVYNSLGTECLSTLSAGEREILALSFLAALRDVAGFKAPIVIDTPLGRISKDPRRKIADMLPHYLQGTQLILLVTEEEYTAEVKERLGRKLAAAYSLRYDERRFDTEVKKDD